MVYLTATVVLTINRYLVYDTQQDAIEKSPNEILGGGYTDRWTDSNVIL
jgi:hypothetical protein